MNNKRYRSHPDHRLYNYALFIFQVKIKVDKVDDGDDNDRDQMLKMIVVMVVVLTMMTTLTLIMMIVCITRGYKCVDSSFNQKKKVSVSFLFSIPLLSKLY